MLKLWSSRPETRKKSVSRGRSLAEQAIIENGDYRDNFHETEEFLIEFAPSDKSGDPDFRREFFALAEEIKALEHPGLLRLYSFGVDGDRFYRAWARRRLSAASSHRTGSFNEKCRALAQVVEGFQLLRNLEVAIELYSPQLISHDPNQGLFLARFPFTRESEPGQHKYHPFYLNFASTPDPAAISPETLFLVRLGLFMGVYFINEVPFAEPPLVSHWKGVPVVRKELPLPEPVGGMVERLTQLEPGKNYPDLGTGLEHAKNALLAAL